MAEQVSTPGSRSRGTRSSCTASTAQPSVPTQRPGAEPGEVGVHCVGNRWVLICVCKLCLSTPHAFPNRNRVPGDTLGCAAAKSQPPSPGAQRKASNHENQLAAQRGRFLGRGMSIICNCVIIAPSQLSALTTQSGKKLSFSPCGDLEKEHHRGCQQYKYFSSGMLEPLSQTQRLKIWAWFPGPASPVKALSAMDTHFTGKGEPFGLS